MTNDEICSRRDAAAHLGERDDTIISAGSEQGRRQPAPHVNVSLMPASRREFGQAWGLILLVVALNLSGCGRTQPPAIDSAPFETAIEHYLVRNGMQLRVKALRTAPVVEGRRAVMSASMTHADLGGPSVVWEFQFEQSADGQWSVVAHTD